ncbi:hypothetical protein B0H11DRAFT_1905482 [Mycena galericulata]|nr:hypothetical protein B0H11DRAFT_1905482 [Mycena galericulata]
MASDTPPIFETTGTHSERMLSSIEDSALRELLALIDTWKSSGEVKIEDSAKAIILADQIRMDIGGKSAAPVAPCEEDSPRLPLPSTTQDMPITHTHHEKRTEDLLELPMDIRMPSPNVGEYRVYGFTLNEDFLLKFALKNGLGTDDDIWQRRWSITRAAEQILDSHGIDPYIVAGVMLKGQMKTCAAIASEDLQDGMPMPPRETIERLKKMLSTDKEPRCLCASSNDARKEPGLL